MANITYQDKDKTIQDGVRNKWRDIDANEVKQAVNSKADEDAVTAGLAGKQNVAAIASTGVSVQFDQPRTYGETTRRPAISLLTPQVRREAR
jgi:hypothetical protein